MRVMMSAVQVNVVRLACESLQEERKSHAGDDESHGEPEPAVHPVFEGLLMLGRHEDPNHRHADDRTGVRKRRDEAEVTRMPDRAALADEIGCHERLAMPRRECVRCAEYESQKQRYE